MPSRSDGKEDNEMNSNKETEPERTMDIKDAIVKMRRANDMAVTLMKDKGVLAVMARDFIQEYGGMPLDQVKGYIASEPLDTKIITDAHTKMIADVIYEIRVPVGDCEMNVLFNIEAQQTDVLNYPLEDRQLYYLVNMLGAQNTNGEYGKLKPCYTVWVLMSPKHKNGNSIAHFRMRPEDLEGVSGCKEMKKANIVLVNLGDPNADVEHESLRMLNAMFSIGDMEENERVRTVRDIGVDVDMNLSREVRDMMDDPMMIMEAHFDYGKTEGRAEGRAEGRVEGRTEGFAMSVVAFCKKHGSDIEDAMDELDVPEDIRNEVREEAERRL